MDVDLTATRSKALFGNTHMLAAACWIADASGVFCASEITSGAQIPPTSAHRILSVLSTCRLVTRLPRPSAERTQWYERNQHSFWDAVRELRVGVADHRPSEVR